QTDTKELRVNVTLVLNQDGSVKSIDIPQDILFDLRAHITSALSKWRFISRRNLDNIKIVTPLTFRK
ncbi:MAG: hypothetical protein Q8K36_02490, partial [Alphaproteobacteria bacterium]|nr:hypothetical protein [Alphaproteobacteria bacterium]